MKNDPRQKYRMLRAPFAVAIIAILAPLGIGQIIVENENDHGVGYFLKSRWMWKFRFEYPYDSVARGEEHEYRARRDSNGRWLPGSREYAELAAYCKARYGISIENDLAEERRCRQRHTPVVFFVTQ